MKATLAWLALVATRVLWDANTPRMCWRSPGTTLTRRGAPAAVPSAVTQIAVRRRAGCWLWNRLARVGRAVCVGHSRALAVVPNHTTNILRKANRNTLNGGAVRHNADVPIRAGPAYAKIEVVSERWKAPTHLRVFRLRAHSAAVTIGAIFKAAHFRSAHSDAIGKAVFESGIGRKPSIPRLSCIDRDAAIHWDRIERGGRPARDEKEGRRRDTCSRSFYPGTRIGGNGLKINHKLLLCDRVWKSIERRFPFSGASHITVAWPAPRAANSRALSRVMGMEPASRKTNSIESG